jgi:CBS domain-containing membrane protein
MDEERRNDKVDSSGLDITDKDIYEAMRDIPGYLDITPGDLKEIYRHAYRHAVKRLATSVKARDVMTRNVVSVAPGTLVPEIARVMAEHGISGVPVVEEGRVVGVISEKDFLAHMGSQGAETFMALLAELLDRKECSTEPLQSQTARDIMSIPPIVADEDATLVEIAALFTLNHVNRAPVVDKEGIMIGIVSRDDLVKASSGGTCGIL